MQVIEKLLPKNVGRFFEKTKKDFRHLGFGVEALFSYFKNLYEI